MARPMKTMIAGLLAAATATFACPPNATAEPVWPRAGTESAGATIDDLQAQGYDVQINWVNGVSSLPLELCETTAIHNPNHAPPEEGSFATVYVDVSCPNRDHDFGWGGIWFGLG